MFCIYFTMIVAAVNSMGKKEITFRPVSIHIVDEQTNEPVEGIKVKVSNVIAREKIYSFFGHPIDSNVQRTYYPIEEFFTDESGYVQIPMYIYKAKQKQYLSGQFIYINVEPIRQLTSRDVEGGYSGIDFYDRENMYYYRPNEKYKAVLIRSWPRQIFESDMQLERTKPYMSVIYKGHTYPPGLEEPPDDFSCEHEEFRIYLERFTRDEEGEM